MNNIPTPLYSRREMISILAVSCASLLSPSLLAGDLSSIQRVKGGPLRKGAVLSLEHMRTLAAVADIIIPRTDTASASEVDVHGVIDDQLAHCQSKEAASAFKKNLESFAWLIRSSEKTDFHKLDPARQNELVRALAHHEPPFSTLDTAWFPLLKSMIALSYYTSEVGGSQELVYDPIPGGYNGHFKLSDNNGRAFSIYHI